MGYFHAFFSLIMSFPMIFCLLVKCFSIVLNHCNNLSKFIEPKTASDGVRVQDIGFLFIDMLRYPDFCGGFDHVLDVFEDCAFIYQNAKLNAANTIGSDIDKERIGFLFEKKLGLHSNILEEWKPKMQRGGSRKLVVNKPFDSCYDDLWAISINHKELHKYGQYKQHEQLD